MKRSLILLLGLALLVPSAWPQASTSSVSGTVRDQSGAVIPNATAEVVGTETNVTLTTKTNDAGVFFFPAIIAGSYRLSVEAPGMEKFRGDFIVRAAQNSVINPVLKPGSLATAVDVTDVTPLVTVDNAVVANTMEYARIGQLPINGRQLNTFQTLLPGAEGSGGTNGFRLFGQPAQAEEWIVDGAVVTDRRSARLRGSARCRNSRCLRTR
ncbi:MAG: carboxypeptidase-like regulatory domain-containing protein [Candidatus Solibacter sp.]|nr:carboxypeptidase-like regulatory domain-containing protein [Candidatus Solibacter sp.]